MKNIRTWITGFCLVVGLFALTACGSSTASAASSSSNSGGGQQAPRFTSAYLNNTYANALPVTTQLALGTLKLEGTPNAVTTAQAGKLLPLWQSLQSGSVQNGTEMGAVYKQIEGTMTPTQMQAIATMKLTRTDLQTWAKSAGVQLPTYMQGAGLSPEAAATRRAQFQAQGGGQGGGQGNGGRGSGGQRGGQGTPGAQGRRGNGNSFLLDPLVKLLTGRAG